MNREYDAIIIGSGAGGGTVAEKLAPLARAGAKIAVLEEGPYYTHEFLTQREIEMYDIYRHRGAWPLQNGSITLAAGKAVGGSTLMYTGVTFRMPDEVIDEWSIPGITPDDLRPRFDRIERAINVIEPGEDMINDNNRLFKRGCERLGWPVKKIRLNLKNCNQTGCCNTRCFCNLGCSYGTKQGTLEVQLPLAEAAGIEVIPNCEVHTLSEKTVRARVSPAPPGTKPGPWPSGDIEMRAQRIILAAGSPGSPAVLLRSGFAKPFKTLGKYFTLHPALTVYGIYPEKIKGYQGIPKTFYTDVFTDSHDYYLETAFYYPFITTKHLGLWGDELNYVMRRYDQLACIIILNHDQASVSNRITVSSAGDIIMRYTLSKESIQSLCHAQAQAARIFFSAGCEKVIMPCADTPLFDNNDLKGQTLEAFITEKNFKSVKFPLSSAHPQGGCRLGVGPEDSVTDQWGQVHGCPWLFVADASLFPMSSHVNPYLTIMALADRVGEHLVDTKHHWLR